jgi:hypothetical protein
MRRTRTIRLALLAIGISIGAAAQSSDQTQPGAQSDQPQPATAPAPGYGQNAPILDPENPPVTGLDEPGLEMRTASHSFIAPALQLSESADSNGENHIGATDIQSVTRVVGALDLQKFWRKSDLFLEYLGGGGFYSSPYDVKQFHAAGLEAVTRWRTGLVTLRDSFNYLPDGSFSIGSFGGIPGLGLATGGMGMGEAGGGLPGQSLGGSQLGSIGNIERLANTAIIDAVQSLNPVSAVTVAGGFSNAHFFDSASCAIPGDLCLINSDQVTAEGGYTRLLSRHDQLGGVYAFQLFQFPQSTGGQVYNHVFNVRWSHRIGGRMSLIVGAGPQYTELEAGGYFKHWSISGRAQFRYRLGRSSLTATYERFTSAGSGFFAGAQTQAARLGFTRPIGRTWALYTDMGYSHNKRLQTLSLLGFNFQTAASYDEGSAGVVLRKHIGRTYDFFAAYRFAEVAFDEPVCLSPSGSCGRIAQRHVGGIGVEWHPTPTRIE